MKKNLLMIFALLLLGISTSTFAQVTEFPFTEDFEEGVMPPTGWTNPDSLWTVGTESNSGTYCARISYTHDGDANLVSPEIALPDNYRLKFFWKDDDITTPSEVAAHDTTYVEITTDGGTTWTTLSYLSTVSNQSAYEAEVIDLSAYGQQTVQIRFRDVTDKSYSAYGTGIDDLVIEEISTDPPSVATLVSPQDGLTDVPLNVTLEWAAGTGDPTGYKVYFDTVNPPVAEVYDGENTTYAASSLTENTTYYWQVVPYNDNGNATDAPVWSLTTIGSVVASFPFADDFETGELDVIWQKYNGLYTGTQISAVGVDNSYCVDMYADNSDFTTPSDIEDAWANAQSGEINAEWTHYIDLAVDLSTATLPQLKFQYSLGYQYNDNYNNFWVLAQGADKEWTELLAVQTNGATVDFTDFEADLSAYAGGEVTLRFFHNSKYMNNYLFFDNVEIGEMPQETVSWANLQWPGTHTMAEGDTLTAYAQVWEDGVTNPDGADDNIQVWFGVSTEDTDPSTWENWMEAEYNAQVGNNDEYKAAFGYNLPAGTYYYASRVRYNGGPYVYGGFSGGFWNGTDNVNGVLTIDPLVISEFPYTVDFEDGMMPPAGWTNVDDHWTLGSESYAGDYCARIYYSHDATDGAVLQFPKISLPEMVKISFFWKDDDITLAGKGTDVNSEKTAYLKEMEDRGIEVAGHDTTFFEISTDGTEWTTLSYLSAASNQSVYSQEVIDLSTYGNSDVYLRFRDVTNSTNSAYGTGIDNITIEEVLVTVPGPATNSYPDDEATNVFVFPILSWDAGEGEPTGYKLYFGTDETPTTEVYDGAEEEWLTETSLAFSTTYYWQVVPYNAEGSADAAECPVWSFTTMADPTIMPGFMETFENGVPPTGWTKYVGLLTEDSELLTSTYGWISDDFGNVVTDPANKSARVNVYGSSRYHWIMTPPVDLGTDREDLYLSFDYSLTAYGTTASAELGEDDLVAVVISTDGGATWSTDNVIKSWNSTTPISTSEHADISLAGYSGSVIFGFYGESTLTNEDVNFYIDNVTVDEMAAGTEFDVAAGWNMLSVPVVTEDMTTTTLLTNTTANVFAFDQEVGYVAKDTLMTGAGYWAKFDAAETISLDGTAPTDNVMLKEGWNMVGGYDYNVAVADVTTDPANIITSDFFEFTELYTVATNITTGKGYWVKASEAGEMILNMAPKKGKTEPTEEMDALYTISMMVSDNGTGSYALGLGLDPNATEGIDSDLGETELPPMPPTGVFDARLMLPDGTTSSPMDYRTGDAGYSGTVEYDLSWQYSSGADALTLDIVIPEVPGTVEMTIVDGFGGAVFSQVVEEGTTQVVVDNANLSALNLNIAYTAPIPVELTGFAANVAGESINLEWSTATETNNKGFEVERSEDGESFSKIAFVDGMGTTTEAQSYIFTDRNAVGGTYYYRLRQVDFDGTYAYSDVVEVEFVPSEYSLQQNYPNPFNPSTTIKFALPVEAKVTVTLYNALGQRVNEIVSNNFTAGVQTVNFNASELASGMYIYQISAQGVDGSNFVDTKKMMLMK